MNSIKKAEKLGYVVTENSYGVTTMVKYHKSGLMEFLNICNETGKFLGKNTI